MNATNTNNATNAINASNAFTYIELLITLAIIAVLFVPIMRLFSHTLYSVSSSQDLITATNLAKWEMERTKNFKATKARFREIGDIVFPSLDKEPLMMNNVQWRIKREIIEESDPLEIRVSASRGNELDKPLVTLVTLIEDMSWEEVVPVK
jgi:prepilin-type N-terminal cleavage/methylation domain-containing protein